MANILLAEMRTSVRLGLARKLIGLGHEVRMAENERRAKLEFYNSRAFRDGGCELLWTSLDLEDKHGGITLIQALREVYPELPTILFTDSVEGVPRKNLMVVDRVLSQRTHLDEIRDSILEVLTIHRRV